MNWTKIPARVGNTNVLLAIFLAGSVMAGQHLITDHVLSAVHLNTWQHLLYFTLTGALVLPAALASVAGGQWLAQRFGLNKWTLGDSAQRAAITSLLFGLAMVVVGALHNLAHPMVEALGVHGHHNDIVRDALLAAALSLPVMLVGLIGAALLRGNGRELFASLPVPALSLRFVSAAVVTSMLVSLLPVTYQTGALAPATTQAAPNTCTSGGPQRTYDVSAIHVKITLNKFGDNDPDGFMYTLDENIPALRAQEASGQVSTALGNDLIQPLVIRANLGDCVEIKFTNRLTNAPASFHVQGLAYTTDNAGGMVGNNPSSFVQPGGNRTYRFSIPSDETAEGAFYFYSHGVSRDLVAHGLFGALVAEPVGSVYLNAESGLELKSGWQAIIDTPSGPDFREFALLFHEVGDEKSDIFDRTGVKLPVLDSAVTGAYRPGSRAINYRSEPFRDRLILNKTVQSPAGPLLVPLVHNKALAYSSYMFGDPATPMQRSYLGEPTKTRLVHAGSEIFHVFHLHGGGTRWRRNPFADDRMEYAQGLKKHPTLDARTTRLDSQSIGPSETFTLEHECGAGGCQQTAGDYLWHCHIGSHYVAGMWSFWRVYDTFQATLATLPDRTALAQAVNSTGLLDKTIEGKTIVRQADLSDPLTQTALETWVEQQLPPQGVPLDDADATVWNWDKQDTGNGLLYLGEPETDQIWPNYQSATPGQRPEILFNPTNGRYAWPLMRPHLGQRPPFSPNNHSGAPWAGEDATPTRPDGMCPIDAPNYRQYAVVAIQRPIQVTEKNVDQGGMVYVLAEDKAAVQSGLKRPEPLVLRSNVNDCVDVILTSELSDALEAHNYSKMNLHIHFVQFDPQASDGVISGMSYEQAVRPYATEGGTTLAPQARTLTVAAAVGATEVTVNQVERLRPGIGIGIGLGDASVEIRKITAITGTVITLDRPLDTAHPIGAAAGVEFVRYRWFSDVDSGTTFFHSHITFTDWYHGLIGAHIIEPAGSTYHDPNTGAEIRSGTVADIHTTGTAGVTDAGYFPSPADGSVRGFREFVVFFTADDPANPPSGGTINLRASPFDKRGPDPSKYFCSATNGDPWTPIFRAYLGDPVIVRGMSVVEKEGALRISGHRFRQERFSTDGDLMDTSGQDVSERYDLILEGGAGGMQQKAGDYLYYSTIKEQFVDGAWGLLRVHDTAQVDLRPLPGRPAPATGIGFPLSQATRGQPQPATDPGAVCPANAPKRTYDISIFRKAIQYSAGALVGDEVVGGIDAAGVMYALSEDEAAIKAGTKATRPLVLRVNAGECLEVTLNNNLPAAIAPAIPEAASIHVGELIFDPQGSYGGAIGYNKDSTVLPGQKRLYRFFADQELGTTLMYDLANPIQQARGAFGAVVVEPAGAFYRNPVDGTELKSGVLADILTPQGSFREFVALTTDEDDRIGQNEMPYPIQVSGVTGINYSLEPLAERLAANPDTTKVFASSAHGDPDNLLRAYAGDPVRFRIGKPWGTQGQVFSIEGHRWPLDPQMAGSNLISSKSLRAGEVFDLPLVGGAGGDFGAVGDYMFGDLRHAFRDAGVWGLMRVHDSPQADLLPLPKAGIVALANQPSTTQAYANQPLSFTYTATNPGTDPLADVTVTDNLCSPVSFTGGDANSDSLLNPGEAWAFACTMTPDGNIVNTARVKAKDTFGGDVVSVKSATVHVINPHITVMTIPSTNSVEAGSAVTYDYSVASSQGDDPLSQVTVADSICSPVNFTGGDTNTNGVLELNELWTYTCATALNADSTNSVTATGLDSFGNAVSGSGNAFVSTLAPALELTVVPNASSVNVGDSAEYNYTVKNAGQTTLTDLALTDSRLGTVSLGTVTLAPGASTASRMIYPVTESDLPGPLVSTVTVTGVSAITPFTVLTSNANTSVAVTTNSVLALQLTVTPPEARPGQVVTYTFTLKNTGDVTLSNLSLTDSRFGDLVIDVPALSPQASTSVVRTYTVAETDLPGPLINTATATANPPAGLPAQANATTSLAVQLTSGSGVDVVQQVSTAQANVGETVTYVFTVENTGNISLKDVRLTDSLLGELLLDTTALAPGAKVTKSVPYEVKVEDLPGVLSNQVSVTAQTVTGEPVSDAGGGTVAVTSSSVTVRHVVKGNTAPLAVYNFQMSGKAFQLPAGQSKKLEWLTPGLKTIEMTTPGWNLVDVQCNTVTAALAGAKANFDLQRGQDIECTVTSELSGITGVERDSFTLYMPAVYK